MWNHPLVLVCRSCATQVMCHICMCHLPICDELMYRSMCHNVHVPREADIVVVEYSLNDGSPPPPLYDNNVRRPFERLLRKLLSYPQ